MQEINYSHNNHYKWGFNDNWFNEAEPEGYFQVSIGACSRPHGSFRAECINAATLLGQTLTKPILVGLSGGLDSQVVCLSLLNAKVPFTPVVLKLLGSAGQTYNQHDIDGAFAFCKKFGLIPIVEELNLDDFYCNEGMKLISENCITVAEIAVQLHLVIKYKDTHAYINGGGDPQLNKYIDSETGMVTLKYSLGPTPIQQYMINNGIQGCLKFFMYTPEQIAAYLNHPIIHAFNDAQESIFEPVNQDIWVNNFAHCIKPMMYIGEWPELVQRRKFTGFERVPYFSKVRMLTHKLNSHINPRAKMVTWTYKEILDHLLSNTGEIKTWRSSDERNYY
jgi:hypothetical protein